MESGGEESLISDKREWIKNIISKRADEIILRVLEITESLEMPDIATLAISASIVKNEKRLCFVKMLFIG